jgi:hypothetical protein
MEGLAFALELAGAFLGQGVSMADGLTGASSESCRDVRESVEELSGL